MDVIAIDGLAGTGKSTLAYRLAQRLGLAHLDTGASFRMMAWAVARSSKDVNSEADVISVVKVTKISYETGICSVGGIDVTDQIRDDEISSVASKIAVYPSVREELCQWQRDWVRLHGPSVVEGRDISSVVFPNAKLKIFLKADELVRSQRRSESTKEAVAERDKRDMKREVAPVTIVNDAVVIDTTWLSVAEVEELVIGIWRNMSLPDENGVEADG